MKSIVINIRRERDLYEKYSNEVSSDLIKYLIDEANVKDDVEVIINTKLQANNIDKLIKEGLKNFYKDARIIDKFYDSKQIRFFIIGIVFLLISTFMGYEILKELVLIIGWFAIYEVVEITFNIDSSQRRKKHIIKKLINCKIKVNNN